MKPQAMLPVALVVCLLVGSGELKAQETAPLAVPGQERAYPRTFFEREGLREQSHLCYHAITQVRKGAMNLLRQTEAPVFDRNLTRKALLAAEASLKALTDEHERFVAMLNEPEKLKTKAILQEMEQVLGRMWASAAWAKEGLVPLEPSRKDIVRQAHRLEELSEAWITLRSHLKEVLGLARR